MRVRFEFELDDHQAESLVAAIRAEANRLREYSMRDMATGVTQHLDWYERRMAYMNNLADIVAKGSKAVDEKETQPHQG